MKGDRQQRRATADSFKLKLDRILGGLRRFVSRGWTIRIRRALSLRASGRRRRCKEIVKLILTELRLAGNQINARDLARFGALARCQQDVFTVLRPRERTRKRIGEKTNLLRFAAFSR